LSCSHNHLNTQCSLDVVTSKPKDCRICITCEMTVHSKEIILTGLAGFVIFKHVCSPFLYTLALF